MKTNVDQYNTLYMKRTRLKCRGKSIANRKKKKEITELLSYFFATTPNKREK